VKRAHFFLIAILLHQFVVAALYEAYVWIYFPGAGGRGEWMKSPIIYWVPLLGFLFLWLKADVNERRIGLSPWASITVPVFFPIGVPYYFLRTYPLRAAASRIGLAFVFAAICVVAIRLGSLFVHNYFAVWTNPMTPPPETSLERRREK
jgi:hypothetical protein